MQQLPNQPAQPDAWAAYVPDEHAPWNARRVVHLHRRAGFAATWGEIQHDLADGPQASIDRVLSGRARGEGAPAEFERIAALLADGAVSSHDAMRLKAWWIYRMLFGPDPLGERLTLMWHNHFATSNLKVRDVGAMRRQNELFREFGRAPFGELLRRMLRDPAVLVWLDAQANCKEHPNENLARELMELFTLGVGHYSENDVKETARALTGWSARNGSFREVAGNHDDGEKTILGYRGPWRGDDVVRILLAQPATARRLAERLCELFMGEGATSACGLDWLAAGLGERELDIGWGVETVLRSQAFFDDKNIGNRVLAPVELIVGSARLLELFDPPPSTLVFAEWTTRLGQDLFYPPNVFGWPGGRAWITTRSLIGRANYAAGLADGRAVGRPIALDALGLAERHGRGADLAAAAGFYCELVLGTADPAVTDRVLSEVGDASARDPALVRRAVALILSAPESQLA